MLNAKSANSNCTRCTPMKCSNLTGADSSVPLLSPHHPFPLAKPDVQLSVKYTNNWRGLGIRTIRSYSDAHCWVGRQEARGGKGSGRQRSLIARSRYRVTHSFDRSVNVLPAGGRAPITRPGLISSWLIFLTDIFIHRPSMRSWFRPLPASSQHAVSRPQ